MSEFDNGNNENNNGAPGNGQPSQYSRNDPYVRQEPGGWEYGYYGDGWQPRRKKSAGCGWAVATAILAAFIAGALIMRYAPIPGLSLPGITHTPAVTQPAETPSAAQTARPQATLPAIGGSRLALGANYDIPAIVQADSPAVVGILNNVNSARNPYGLQQGFVTQSSGSGVIVSSDGYIVTNNHVVEGADSLTVVLAGGEEVPAELVGADAQTDLAVVKVDRTGLNAIPIGDSDAVLVGEMVLAIGNPLGPELAGTVTMGIVSAKNRQIQNEGYTFNLLQTDAAINPGNSGGALVDMRGNLIGINQMKISTSEVDEYGMPVAAEGIGFAIPVNDAMPIVRALIQDGYIPRPMLGIDVSQEITRRMAQRNRIPVGIYLERLTSGGPAQKAGVRDGDILTKVDGRDTPTFADMNAALSAHSIGETVQVEVWRNGNTMTFDVVLEGQNSE
jgi:serine protease Do